MINTLSKSIFSGVGILALISFSNAQILVEDFSSNDLTGSGQSGSAAGMAWTPHVNGAGTFDASSGALVLTAGPNSGQAVDVVSASGILTDSFILQFDMDPSLAGFASNSGPGVMFGMSTDGPIAPATATEAYFVSQLNFGGGTSVRFLRSNGSGAGWNDDEIIDIGLAWDALNTFRYEVSFNGLVSTVDIYANNNFITTSSYNGSFGGTHVGFYTTDGGNDGASVQTTFDNINISIVPEPGACGLLAGMLALSWVALRRR